jgi:hypothetical protein
MEALPWTIDFDGQKLPKLAKFGGIPTGTHWFSALDMASSLPVTGRT